MASVEESGRGSEFEIQPVPYLGRRCATSYLDYVTLQDQDDISTAHSSDETPYAANEAFLYGSINPFGSLKFSEA
jgi:hypothetical protein